MVFTCISTKKPKQTRKGNCQRKIKVLRAFLTVKEEHLCLGYRRLRKPGPGRKNEREAHRIQRRPPHLERETGKLRFYMDCKPVTFFSLKVYIAKTRILARCQKRYLSRAFGQCEWVSSPCDVGQFLDLIQPNESEAI